MDLVKSRYRTFDELYGYCYKVAGTVALMTTPVMGIDPAYPVRNSVIKCRNRKTKSWTGLSPHSIYMVVTSSC